MTSLILSFRISGDFLSFHLLGFPEIFHNYDFPAFRVAPTSLLKIRCMLSGKISSVLRFILQVLVCVTM